MPTLLERYMRGECEEVWEELHRLGADVRNTGLREDATAVAKETVRRAKLNLKSIIEGLTELGYRFANSRAERGGILKDPPKNIKKLLAAFERNLGGPLPLVLIAWYEQIGEASLMGSHPVLCPQTLAGATTGVGRLSAGEFRSMRDQVSADPFVMDPFDASSFDQFRRAADPARRLAVAEARLREFDEMMARMRASIPEKVLDVFAQTEERLRPTREELEQAVRNATKPMVFQLALGPDDVMKFGESGDSYYVALPDLGADFLIRTTGPEETFVQYLRRSFRCAGFAGWDGRPDVPPQLQNLGSNLLPL